MLLRSTSGSGLAVQVLLGLGAGRYCAVPARAPIAPSALFRSMLSVTVPEHHLCADHLLFRVADRRLQHWMIPFFAIGLLVRFDVLEQNARCQDLFIPLAILVASSAKKVEIGGAD